MKVTLNYNDIVKNAHGDETKMLEAVSRVDKLVEEIRKVHPEKAEKFLLDEYVAVNGKHFNEAMAKKVVSEMWHEDSSKKMVEGEAVTPSEAMRLLEGMDAEKQEKMRWDAYVAANAFMHDLGNTGMSRDNIMTAAKHFWFHDDDIGNGCHKVFWYFFK